MNIPEKLYLQPHTTCEAGRRKLSLYKMSNEDIEYTCTDVFIEKVAEYLEATLSFEFLGVHIQSYINTFKKEIKNNEADRQRRFSSGDREVNGQS